MAKTELGRCVHCRSEIVVPDSYAHGDHIKCGACGTNHKVSRGETLRLVVADVTPLKEALHDNQRLVERLEDELRGARRSMGIGFNGLGVGIVYLLWQVALADQAWSTGLLVRAAFIAIGSGAALELINWLFLAKRQRIARLTDEIRDAREDGRELQKTIREAGRV
jgi:hypothetical protein